MSRTIVNIKPQTVAAMINSLVENVENWGTNQLIEYVQDDYRDYLENLPSPELTEIFDRVYKKSL